MRHPREHNQNMFQKKRFTDSRYSGTWCFRDQENKNQLLQPAKKYENKHRRILQNKINTVASLIIIVAVAKDGCLTNSPTGVCSPSNPTACCGGIRCNTAKFHEVST